jgi:hypothetical protein
MYHYTDVNGALGILQSGELWFTERAHLNDPVEISYGINIAHELFEKAIQNKSTIPRETALHLRGEHEFGLATYGFWVFSASLHDDDLGQWRNYADDGRGVCLGFAIDYFDMQALAAFIPNVTPNSLRFPINYDQHRLRSNMQRYIDTGAVLLERVNLAARDSYYAAYGDALLYERDFFRILNDGVYANSLLSKHAAYQHEQEYRLLISGTRTGISTSDRHFLRERNGEILGYLKLPIPAWKKPGVLTHARIGPAASPHLIDQIRTTVTTLNIPMPKIDKSAIPYRSRR